MVARIMTVVDIYDALITDRPYRQALSQEKAISILKEESRSGKLDPDVVDNLFQMVSGCNKGNDLEELL